MTKYIPLTQGKAALADDDDYNWLMRWKWKYNSSIQRACRCIDENGKRRTIYMHRLILQAPDGVQVDHVNGDRLDNRRANLRLASATENQRNKCKVLRATTSRYKGVYLCRRTGRWCAMIKAPERRIWIGRFDTETDAARAYDAAARKHFGIFARLNFPI